MKKIVMIVALMIFIFALAGCSNSNNDDLEDVKSTLEGIGYVFEQRDEDAITYYNNKAVNEAFEIDVTLTDLYIGYVDGDQGWLELLEFETNADADEYIDNTTDSGYVIYRQGSVVFITYSSDALVPFNDNSDSVKGD